MHNKYNSGFTIYDVLGGFNFNVRNVMELNEKVDGEVLKRAVNMAMHRYPYMKKRIIIKNDEYVYIDNDLPVVVYEHNGETLPFGSRELNYHLVSVDYKDNNICFNLSHTICGGCGILPWIKTTLYAYFKLKYGRELNVPDLNRPEDLPVLGEREMPDISSLPVVKNVGMSRIAFDVLTDTKQPDDYFKDPAGNPQYYYLMEIPVKEFMQFSHLHDGSPASLLSSFMYRACLNLFPDNNKPIQGAILQNYRAAAGCPKTTCDIIRSIIVTYPDNAKDWDIDKLNTFNRGSVIIQSESCNGINEAKELIHRYEAIDRCATIDEKIRYCQENPGLILKNPVTYIVSYEGNIDWGDIIQYLRAKHTIVDGGMFLEVASVGSNFDVVLEQLDDSDKYIKALTYEFDKEGISYVLRGPFKKDAATFRLDMD